MTAYKRIPTSAEVYAVLRARHGKEMGVYSSFSDPDGSFNGGSVGCMETEWAIKGSDTPILSARTTWEIDPEATYKRINEQNEYWLCYPTRSEE